MTRLRDLLRREPTPGLALPDWLERLLSVGIVTRNPQLAQRQRSVNVACYAAAVSCASYLVITSLYDFDGLLLLNAYNAMMIVMGAILPRWHRLGANVVDRAHRAISPGRMYVIWMLGINSDSTSSTRLPARHCSSSVSRTGSCLSPSSSTPPDCCCLR